MYIARSNTELNGASLRRPARRAAHRARPSVHAKVHARGPVRECRPIIVDREQAYGGAFKSGPIDGEGAGG